MAKGNRRPRQKGADHPKGWPAEQEQWLREAILINRSYQLLAQSFNRRFNMSKTRSAILGKCRRLKITDNKPDDAADRVVAARKRKAKQKPSKGPRMMTVLRRAEAAAPVQTAGADDRVSIREEGDPGAPALGPGRKLRSGQVEELAKRRLGFIPDIGGAATTTAKPASELGRMECRWPISDGLACGAKTTVRSYCLEHARRAFRVMPTEKRNKAYGH